MEGGPPEFTQDFSCPALLRILMSLHRFRLQGYHLLWPAFPSCLTINVGSRLESYNPDTICIASVWAFPGSLATTTGISVDFSSSGY